MARAATTQIRLRGADLVRALHAAAAFTHADKKSHRHCINLRTIGTDDQMRLLVAGGSPVRVLVASTGLVTGDDLALDLTPGAAAVIVKLFAGSDDVALKHDGKVLAVAAQDQLFDNQRIEVRTLPIDQKADSLRIAALAAVLGEWTDVPRHLSADMAGAIAKAAKALGVGPTIDSVGYNDVTGARIRFGSGAVAYCRAGEAPAELSDAWNDLFDVAAPADESPWYADHIHLGHILDGVAPLHAVKDPDTTDEPVEAEDTGVDLADVEADTALPERPVSLASVLADDDTAAGDAA